MKHFKWLTLVTFLLLLTDCKPFDTKVSSDSVEFGFKQKKENIYFNIIQLNDVYEISPIQGGKFGGMARVETLHKAIAKENNNTLLVLAGDFLNPSLLGTIKVNGERVRGKQMVEVMNAMNFDVVAFGNHEFDLSYSNLQERLNESTFDWVSANVYHNSNGAQKRFYKVVEGEQVPVHQTFIKEIQQGNESLKIGFISVCIPSNPRSYVAYTDMYLEAKKSYESIKNEVDVVIGLTHVKLEQDRTIAEILPDVPLIMGGHEHTHKYEKVGNSVITKADANAKTVYIHRFEYNTKTKEVQFKSQLKTIDASIPEDKEVGAIVQKWESLLNTKIKEVIDNPNEIIFTAKEPLEARDTPIRSKQTNMGNLVAEAMSLSYDNEVECAFVNGGSIRIDDVLQGDISAVDIFRVLPYGGPILKVKLKGSLLEEVLNYGMKAAGTGAYLQHYQIQKSTSGSWLVQNKPIDSNKIYTVATSDYLLKGFDIPFLKPSNEGVINVYSPNKKEVAFDVRKAVIQLLKSR